MVELHHRTEEDKGAEVKEVIQTHRSSKVNTADLLKYSARPQETLD